MIDEKKLDQNTLHRYHKAMAYGGFGLWWFVMIAAALLGEEHLSETALMWMLFGCLGYVVFTLTAVFWTHYSKNARQVANASPEERKKQISEIVWSGIGGFVCMFIIRFFFREGSIIENILLALAVAMGTVGWMYLMQIRRPRTGSK